MKVGEVREGYIAKWKSYPMDEEKIRVARPSVLAPSKELLADFKERIENFVKEHRVSERFAREVYWSDYRERYCQELSARALKKILEITALVLNGKTVRLICYEKEFPCHRFILKYMIEEKVSTAKQTIEHHVGLVKQNV